VVVGQESLDVLAGELGQAADLGVGSRQVLGVLASSRPGAPWQQGDKLRTRHKPSLQPGRIFLTQYIRWSMLPGP